MAEMFTKPLIDSRTSLSVHDVTVTRGEAAPDCPHDWSVRLTTLHGGRQEGVRLIEIEAAGVRVRAIPTRGMNVLDAQSGGLRLGWDSPVREVVHPTTINLQSRGGLGWLEGFNEFVARCGLEWFGAPCRDDHHHAAAEPPAGDLTLHGRISNIPASAVTVLAERKPPYRVTLRSLVHERGLFTPNLDLESDLTITPGEARFTILDRITNRSAQAQEFGILYHINQGTPVLGEGARVEAPVRRVTPRDDRAAGDAAQRWDTFEGPRAGFAEQVYFLDLAAGGDGRTEVLLRSRDGDLGVGLTYPLGQLPAFTLWKNTAAEADGYVAGLEPGTNHPNPRPVERALGKVPILQPGQTHTAQITIDLYAQADAVAAAERRIRVVRGGGAVTIDTSPPATG